MKKYLALAAAAPFVLLLLIQLVPYGHNHTNPAVVQNAPWLTPEAEQIARRACYDCHSNETSWPWYSNIAPVSWLVEHDVDDGRSKLNFSKWGQGEQEIEEAAEVVREGEMPPANYLITHPEARLSAAEKATLIQSLVALGGETGESHEADDDND